MKTRVWKEYQVERSRSRSGRMLASLSRGGILMLNGEAYRALGNPFALKVLFDESDGGAIGVVAAAPYEANALQFHTTAPRSGRYLTLTHFCSLHAITPPQTIVFDDLYLEVDGTLVLELSRARAVSGRKRKNSQFTGGQAE